MDPGGSSHFEQTADPARAYTNTLTAGRITAMGDRYESCGDEHPHFCSQCGKPAKDDDGDLVMIGETCWRQQCPRCGAGWSMRRAVPIVSKIESLRKEITAQRSDSPKFHHLAVRMDDFRAARDADDTFFDVVKTAVDEVGVNVYGGAIIHHSYSGNDDDEEDDLGKWKERVFSNRDWNGDVEDELKEWHHAHVLVLADSIDHLSCESLYENTDIFIHRIQNEDDDNNVSLYGVKDLAEATTYCLSHARLADDADAYRYFGTVANHSADHRIEARCKEVVRSVVPKTLDLYVDQNELCGREIAASELDHIPSVVRGSSDDGSDTGENDAEDDSTDTDDTTTEDSDTNQDDTKESESETDNADSEADTDTSAETDQDTEVDTAESDAPESGSSGVHCNGRMIPLRYAPSFLDDGDRDLAYEDELRETYREFPIQNTLDEHAD